jgi:hypothetical protein
VYINQRLQIQLELLTMMSGVPLETCWAFSKFWNNKLYYKVTSCWLFLPIHTTMHESMNIKFPVDNQLDAQIFYNTFIYINALHVLSTFVLILRRTTVWIQLLI